MELCGVHTFSNEVFVPKQWAIIQDGIVIGETHVVWQTWPRQWHWCVVRQLTLCVQYSVVHVWVRGLVVEEQQVTCALINFWMRRNTSSRERVVP